MLIDLHSASVEGTALLPFRKGLYSHLQEPLRAPLHRRNWRETVPTCHIRTLYSSIV